MAIGNEGVRYPPGEEPGWVIERGTRTTGMNTIEPSAEPFKAVDSTPDGGYALRILEAYRAELDCRIEIVGDGEWDENDQFEVLCKRQEQRAAELDKAIEVLREEKEELVPYAPEPAPEPAAVLTHISPPVAVKPFTLTDE